MKLHRVVGAALCAILFLFNQPIVAWAQDAAPAVSAATKVTAGQLVGLDGKTTWAGRVVRLTDAEGKLVAEVTTGEQGQFTLPELVPGTYVLDVGQVARRFTITPERPVRQLRLVVSAEQLQGERIAMADLNQVADEGTQFLMIIGTTLVFAVIGVGGAIVGYNLKKSNGDTVYVTTLPVSPFTP